MAKKACTQKKWNSFLASYHKKHPARGKNLKQNGKAKKSYVRATNRAAAKAWHKSC